MTQTPKNWPLTLPYLNTSTRTPYLPTNALTTLRTKPIASNTSTIPSSHPRGPSPLVKITPITNQAHPANGQCGLFATRDLKPRTLVCVYLGVVHVSNRDVAGMSGGDDPHGDSNYDLSLDRESGLGVDAATAGNEARFINDYRGVPGMERPNAEFRDCWDERVGERGMGVWVLPAGKAGKGKGIRKGEEVLVSYGRGFWGARKGEADVG